VFAIQQTSNAADCGKLASPQCSRALSRQSLCATAVCTGKKPRRKMSGQNTSGGMSSNVEQQLKEHASQVVTMGHRLQYQHRGQKGVLASTSYAWNKSFRIDNGPQLLSDSCCLSLHLTTLLQIDGRSCLAASVCVKDKPLTFFFDTCSNLSATW
jgi:hypothetical protein